MTYETIIDIHVYFICIVFIAKMSLKKYHATYFY